jgi:hypothetical protein
MGACLPIEAMRILMQADDGFGHVPKTICPKRRRKCSMILVVYLRTLNYGRHILGAVLYEMATGTRPLEIYNNTITGFAIQLYPPSASRGH